MNPSQRIALNTVATYARSVLAAALSLFSVRWILKALGQTDFGIYTIVGSLIIFIAFLNSVMAASAGRHFAFAIGQGDPVEVKRWFNAAFSVHMCLATILVLIGWPLGEYLIVNLLSIPTDRIKACLWVFRISLIPTFVGMAAIPFVAMFTAKQRIAELSVWGMMKFILIFILAWCLTRAQGDRLMVYAIGMAAIMVFIDSAQVIRAFVIFRECAIDRHMWFETRRIKKIFYFASWNLIGALGGTMSDQGSAILLNLFFGPKANAAYGIARQVSSQANQLAAAMMGAFFPEITTSEGSGNRQRMLALSLQACKFGTILVMLLAIPLMAEMDYVLEIWLGVPPDDTALFCNLILGTFLIERLSAGYMMAVNAQGRIAAYQATLGTILLMALPLSWVFLKLGYPPTSVGISIIITMLGCSAGRILWGRYLLEMSIVRWFVSVLIPCSIVACLAVGVAMVPRLSMQSSFIRLVAVTCSSVTVTLIAAWGLALDTRERNFFSQNGRRLWQKATAML